MFNDRTFITPITITITIIIVIIRLLKEISDFPTKKKKNYQKKFKQRDTEDTVRKRHIPFCGIYNYRSFLFLLLLCTEVSGDRTYFFMIKTIKVCNKIY